MRRLGLGLASVLFGCKPAIAVEPALVETHSVGAPEPPIDEGDRLVEVTAGAFSSCARSESGVVACWGRDVVLTETALVDTHEPVIIDVPPADQIAAGRAHWCARTQAGQVWCWGGNRRRQLGNGTKVSMDYTPAAVPGVEGAVDLAAQGERTCARIEDGSVVCWGSYALPTPTELAPGPLAVDVERGLCAQDPWQCEGDPEPRNAVWGAFGFSGWSLKGTSEPAVRETVRLAECTTDRDGITECIGQDFRPLVRGAGVADGRLTVGFAHVCGAAEKGIAWCAGSDALHQSGPVDGLEDVVSIAAGAFHTCAVTGDGTLRCWGLGSSGQVGLPALARVLPPTKIELPAKATSVARHGEGICVETTDGVVCPPKDCARAGFQSTGYASIHHDDGFSCLHNAGRNASCSGTLSVWGPAPLPEDLDGQLRRFGDTRWCAHDERLVECRSLPFGAADDSLTGISADASLEVGCGIDPRGGLVCAALDVEPRAPVVESKIEGSFASIWLNEGLGRRTDGTIVWIEVVPDGVEVKPFPVPDVAQISREGNRTCAVDRSGAAWCWGWEEEPQRVEIPTPVRTIATRLDHACAVDDAGDLWCWGKNERGQLGRPQSRCAAEPVDLTAVVMKSMSSSTPTRQDGPP